MKTILCLLLFFIFPTEYCTQELDLYITIDDQTKTKGFKSKKNRIITEFYSIGFAARESPKIKLSMNEQNEITRGLTVHSSGGGGYSLLYQNVKNDNPARNIKLSEMKYQIRYDELQYTKETDFDKFIANFKNVYLVDISTTKEVLKAKKIRIIRNPSL